MKKRLSILLLMSMLFTLFASVGHAASPPPKLFLNGKPIISDVEPRIVEGSTLVPLAVLSEDLGYEVDWDGTIRKVTVKDDSTQIEMIIGESAVLVNGDIVETNVKPQLINWRTMVPVRFVGQLLGLDFEWKETEREVHMFDKQPEQPKPDPEQPGTDQPGTEQPGEEGTNGEGSETDTPDTGETDKPDEGESTDPEQEPQLETGYISSISLREDNVIHITNSGIHLPKAPLQLEEPRRLVFDFPATSYIPDLMAGFVNGQTGVKVEDNPHITGYRFSQFSADPLTARLVLEIGEDTGYVVKESRGLVEIALMPADQVPVPEPEPDPEPNLPEPDDGVFDIVIDAGHGGSDPGSESKSLNRWEKEFNLTVALMLQAELEKLDNVRVHMTRTDDTYIALLDRVAFAEEKKADMFISIHANSYTKTSVSGTETYFERENSKGLAEIMHKHLLGATGFNDRGVRQAAYKVIKETTMPAVLLESGYLSNPEEAKKLFDKNKQKDIVQAIVKGVKEYWNLK
ncbi:N-acetylmuramoyl-L-alanine amidase [Paenibacillus sp. J5C2022]|uniref:N-acetylmuramoyl-L-alanine amidase n=1 Tax=Paenibacillus sp. J5C2022 TaxID=2977129 RepID=UPI0021D34200|nr:N-acetylmuramoyl-L-alanine amidase [Paenibacillus sp. J5C2022]